MFIEIVNAAKEASPLTPNKPRKLWWSKEREEARAVSKRCFRELKNPIEDNRNAYQNSKKFAEAVRNSKANSWKEFASSLTPKSVVHQGCGESCETWTEERNPVCQICRSCKMIGRRLRTEKAELSVKTYTAVTRVLISKENGKAAIMEFRDALKRPKDAPMDQVLKSRRRTATTDTGHH